MPGAAGWRRALPALVAAVVAAGLLVGLGAAEWHDWCFERQARRITAVVFPGGRVTVEVAVTPAERRSGLAGRPSLAPDHGMLFVYPDTAPRSFTMEGMRFDLDLVTLDRSGTVTGVLSRRAGDGPFTLPPAAYVLEVAAGWAVDHGVAVGSRAELDRD